MKTITLGEGENMNWEGKNNSSSVIYCRYVTKVRNDIRQFLRVRATERTSGKKSGSSYLLNTFLQQIQQKCH